MLQVLNTSISRTGLTSIAKEEDYTIEGPVTKSAVLELLKSGKEAELSDIYTILIESR